MSRLSSEEVREIAQLARLSLGEHEIARMTQDLDAILGHVDALKELDTAATEPMTHAVPFDCPLRADVQGVALSVDEALLNAPRREGSYFQVPRILPGPSSESAPPGSTSGSTGGSTGGTTDGTTDGRTTGGPSGGTPQGG